MKASEGFYFYMGIATACAYFEADKTVWKIILPLIVCFIVWMVYELDNAVEYNEEDHRSFDQRVEELKDKKEM